MANPLLKFMEELVTNKNSRVTFENVSPNGILLFKETSRILVTYGTRALAQPQPHVRQRTCYGHWFLTVFSRAFLFTPYVSSFACRVLSSVYVVRCMFVLLPALDASLPFRNISFSPPVCPTVLSTRLVHVACMSTAVTVCLLYVCV